MTPAPASQAMGASPCPPRRRPRPRDPGAVHRTSPGRRRRDQLHPHRTRRPRPPPGRSTGTAGAANGRLGKLDRRDRPPLRRRRRSGRPAARRWRPRGRQALPSRQLRRLRRLRRTRSYTWTYWVIGGHYRYSLGGLLWRFGQWASKRHDHLPTVGLDESWRAASTPWRMNSRRPSVPYRSLGAHLRFVGGRAVRQTVGGLTAPHLGHNRGRLLPHRQGAAAISSHPKRWRPVPNDGLTVWGRGPLSRTPGWQGPSSTEAFLHLRVMPDRQAVLSSSADDRSGAGTATGADPPGLLRL